MDAEDSLWLESLPPALTNHRLLLIRLVRAVEQNPLWRFLMVSCSLARGVADQDSDLDVGLGVDEAAWDHAMLALPPLLASLGDVVDQLQHQLAAASGVLHQRTFVQYANGVQLDLVAFPAALRVGRPPETVVLYDPDQRLVHTWLPSSYSADPATVREWAFLGWIALANLDKYLRRGSLWEALDQLHEARTQVWRLWAVTYDITYPAFGLTSVLDSPQIDPPPNIAATVALLDREGLHHAALACAVLLRQVSQQAAEHSGASTPEGMAHFVCRRLGLPPAR